MKTMTMAAIVTAALITGCHAAPAQTYPEPGTCHVYPEETFVFTVCAVEPVCVGTVDQWDSAWEIFAATRGMVVDGIMPDNVAILAGDDVERFTVGPFRDMPLAAEGWGVMSGEVCLIETYSRVIRGDV